MDPEIVEMVDKSYIGVRHYLCIVRDNSEVSLGASRAQPSSTVQDPPKATLQA